MPANHPNPRPAGGLLIALFLVALIIPAVSADETIVSENLVYTLDTSASGTNVFSDYYNDKSPTLNMIYIANVEQYSDLSYIGAEYPGNMATSLTDGENSFTYTFNDYTATGHVYVSRQRDMFGSVTKTRLLFFFDDWDIGSSSGTKPIVLSCSLGTGSNLKTNHNWLEHNVDVFIGRVPASGMNDWYMTIAASTPWKNNIEIVKTESPDGYLVTLDRTVDAIPYTSTINITKNGNSIFTNTQQGGLFQNWYSIDEVDAVVLSNNYNSVFNYPLVDSGETPTDSATVYVQNSQTGALLANANLAILASASGTETEIINATLPGGVGTYQLQPTGGGSPNPDYYRAVATVPGFTQIIENHSFTLNGPHDVIIEMRPDSGGPADPERAYLEFYVRDLNANPIPAASIQCGGRILQTNSAGYAVFEVAKNASHPWIAKKSGYVTIEGTATVADGPRYVVNVVLGPGTVPTYTPGPGETPGGPGATPTPDRRTNEEKGQAVIDLIADFAEPIALLAIVATVFGLMQMIMPRRR